MNWTSPPARAACGSFQPGCPAPGVLIWTMAASAERCRSPVCDSAARREWGCDCAHVFRRPGCGIWTQHARPAEWLRATPASRWSPPLKGWHERRRTGRLRPRVRLTPGRRSGMKVATTSDKCAGGVALRSKQSGREPRLKVIHDDGAGERWSPRARLLFIIGARLGLWIMIGAIIFAVVM